MNLFKLNRDELETLTVWSGLLSRVLTVVVFLSVVATCVTSGEAGKIAHGILVLSASLSVQVMLANLYTARMLGKAKSTFPPRLDLSKPGIQIRDRRQTPRKRQYIDPTSNEWND